MSTGSLIGGIVGGVAGFFIGGPAGAAAGFGIGMGLGAALTPLPGMSQQGPRLSDLKVQTSTYGAAIPRVHGTVGITGNVIWLEGNQLKEVVTRRKVKAGGKGGGKKTTVTTYTYYATLAIGLCEGPIAGVRRIWAGPNLIYDAASDDLETIIASNQASANFSIYRGDAGQQPDVRIQADRGVANTPAYRGLAYVVIKDFLLTDYGNALPAFKVEVCAAANDPGLHLISTFSIANPLGVGSGFGCYAPHTGSTMVSFFASDDAWYNTPTYYRIPAYVGGGHVRTALKAGVRRTALSSKYRGSVSPLWMDNGAGGLLYGDNAYNLDANGVDDWAAVGDVVYVLLSGVLHRLTPADDFTRSDASIGAPGYLRMWVEDGIVYLFKTGSVMLVDAGTLATISTAINEITIDSFTTTGGGDGRIYIADGASSYSMTRIRRLRADMSGIDITYTIPALAATPQGGAIFSISSGTLIRAYSSLEAFVCENWSIGAVYPGSESLADVIRSESELSGIIAAADIDVSGVSGDVLGYAVSRVGALRSSLEPLRAAYPFDYFQSGYILRCVSRGSSSVATIDISELGADEQLPQAREMDGQMPARMAIKYLDAARNYDANEQFAERINTDAVNDSEIELALVMTSSQAAQVVERLLGVAWLERVAFGPFQLPPSRRNLEPADVITIAAGYAQYEMRLTEVSYNADGTLTCSALPNNAAVYVSAAVSVEVPSAQTIGMAGESLFIPIDIPVIDETIQDAPGFVGAATGYTSSWPGAVAVQSIDGGQTWSEIQAFDGKATAGYAVGALAANSCALIDESELSVSLLSGELESVTEAQMLAGANRAAYGADGRWEIVRFRDAALQVDGSYRLSGFKRGDKGTEWATGLHQPGDLFVPLDDGDLAAIGVPVESVGVESTWRGVTAGDTVDSASDVPFTYRGVNLRPLSPAYPVSSRNGSGDLSLAWTRRSRLSSSWWATGTAAPLGEASEAYQVDVLNGSTVVRTIASSTPSITYTAAQQTADFGSAQASVAIRIYQLSAVVGRGYALEVTA